MDRLSIFQDSAIPLYYQIETILRKKISTGELASGDHLPTEMALAEEYNVSRITIRQALSSLERDGLILRKRGIGTIVKRKRFSLDLLKFTGFMEDYVIQGATHQTKVLNFSEVKFPDQLLDFIPLAKDKKGIRIERLRLADGHPYCYFLNYLPTDIGKQIQPDDLVNMPLLKILEEHLGIRLDRAIQTFEATIADTQMASLLDVRVGHPLLQIQRTVFDPNNTFIEYVSVHYRADKCLFKVKLQRERSGDTLNWALARDVL